LVERPDAASLALAAAPNDVTEPDESERLGNGRPIVFEQADLSVRLMQRTVHREWERPSKVRWWLAGGVIVAAAAIAAAFFLPLLFGG
jgi:hypothetical protein